MKNVLEISGNATKCSTFEALYSKLTSTRTIAVRHLRHPVNRLCDFAHAQKLIWLLTHGCTLLWQITWFIFFIEPLNADSQIWLEIPDTWIKFTAYARHMIERMHGGWKHYFIGMQWETLWLKTQQWKWHKIYNYCGRVDHITCNIYINCCLRRRSQGNITYQQQVSRNVTLPHQLQTWWKF